MLFNESVLSKNIEFVFYSQNLRVTNMNHQNVNVGSSFYVDLYLRK